jgi:hypothetical protein
MNEPGKTIQDVEIYTATTRWCGDLTVPSLVRVSDFLNDDSRCFLTLCRVTKANCHNGMLSEINSLDEVAINKRNALAVVLRAHPPRARGDCPDLVQKVLHRVMIYAPPFVLAGDMHRARDVSWVDALNGWGFEFFPLTDVAASWLDSHALLGEGMEFVAVNRQWITAVHPLFQWERPPAQHSFWPVPQKQVDQSG